MKGGKNIGIIWNIREDNLSEELEMSLQARSQDFMCVCVCVWGGGGGAYLKNQDQIINSWMNRYSSFEDIQRRVSNLRTSKFKLLGAAFIIVLETLTSAEHWRREKLGGSGDMPPSPRKFLYLKALKRHSQHSQADGCVKKLPKIVYFRLNCHKKIVVISCVSKIYNHCGTPFNARKIRY